jgi:heme oxygenase (mycobilin-producing)
VIVMNIFMTNGTYEFMNSLKDKHPNETMILMQDNETTLLVHETEGSTVFASPRKYEVIDQNGDISNGAFFVFNNIPISEEGRPVFEFRFKNRARLIEQEPGFAAIRVLRPLSSDTYVILTAWQGEKDFLKWQESKAYEKAHEKRKTENGIDQQQSQIFLRPSFLTKYHLIKNE